MIAALPRVKERIEAEHAPAGYNVGINDREAAGQTVSHWAYPVSVDR